jgi:hypothetical protein
MDVGQRVAAVLGGAPEKNIIEVASGPAGPMLPAVLSQREWRLIRFAVNRALESL